MSTLLLGSETLYPDTATIDAAADEAFKFTAVASGTLDTLEIYVGSGSATATQVYLSVYSDSGDAPNTRLAYGGPVNVASAGTGWVAVTGLSLAITSGTPYWLGVTPLDGHFSALKAFAGARDVVTNNGSPYVTAPGNPWRGIGDGNFSYDRGPVAFRGMAGGPGGPGITPPPAVPIPTHVEVALTTLHRPAKTTSPTAAADPARVLAWAQDYSSLLVTIPRNDARTGEVTFSIDDEIVSHLYRDATENVTGHQVQISTDHEVMLFVRYRGTPILWAPVVSADWKGSDRTVTVNAVDVQMLIDHQIHLGDAALPDAEADRWVPATSDGIRTLMDAATPSTDQTNDGTPSHGINKPDAGTGTTEGATMQIATSLDDPVWEKITELAGYEKSVDIAVIPRDVEGGETEFYSDLVCYVDQGTDRPTVVFESGFGRDNAESMDWSPGAAYMTHAIVRDAENKDRVPRANVDSRRRTGIYSHTENLSSASPPGTMTARAQALIRMYSLPVDAHSIVIRDAPSEIAGINGVVFHYPDDYDLGDTITCEVQDGYFRKRVHGQINEIRVRQADTAVFKEEVDVVPELIAVTDIGDEDP